ncbi:uncharacterized protein [Venturia canescens]|uniref:uncharacterized protein n=1 Tax=Venturia canescens TaxID=32260 RepID=UPI001C9BDB04|nr:uncharacterized protein LOC122407709 [Venturia canescens]
MCIWERNIEAEEAEGAKPKQFSSAKIAIRYLSSGVTFVTRRHKFDNHESIGEHKEGSSSRMKEKSALAYRMILKSSGVSAVARVFFSGGSTEKEAAPRRGESSRKR